MFSLTIRWLCSYIGFSLTPPELLLHHGMLLHNCCLCFLQLTKIFVVAPLLVFPGYILYLLSKLQNLLLLVFSNHQNVCHRAFTSISWSCPAFAFQTGLHGQSKGGNINVSYKLRDQYQDRYQITFVVNKYPDFLFFCVTSNNFRCKSIIDGLWYWRHWWDSAHGFLLVVDVV